MKTTQSSTGQPFLNIDTDVLLLIVSYLEVRDIIALRQTCRGLSQRCLDHSVWSTVVMNNIVSKKLLWPSYAWPLFEVPAVTLEQLCVRAVQMETKWDTGRLKKESKLSRCIQRPWNSITWMAMLRSRWLLVQLNARRLELWDIESPFTSSPVSYFDALDSMVDGYKLLQTPGGSVTIALSVRSYKTYHIRIVLPQIGVLAGQAPQFGLLNTVVGCSGLLEVDKDLAVFSRSSSDDGAIAQCQKSAVFSILESEREDPKLAYAVGVKITGGFVMVVRRTAIELYSVDAIQRDLQPSERTHNRVNIVLPTQCIPFPGVEHALRATFLNRPLHCVDLPYHGTDAIYIGIDRDEKSSRTIRVLYPDTPDGAAGRKFTLSQPLGLLDIEPRIGDDSTVLCMWGETGRRMVHVGDVGELCVRGLSIPVGFENERFVVPVEEREVSSWRIPDSRRDLARYLAFDEATGVCAVALGSGRIWITDPFCETGLKGKDAPLKKIEFENPPHPDPAWRFIPRKPWAGEHGHPSVGREVLLPLMATKVYRWFPGKNNPEAFGGVKWFVNEVLHIPGPATVLLVGTPLPYGYPRDSVDIVCLEGRLLRIDRVDDLDLCYVKLLDANITLEDVVDHLKGRRFPFNLPGKEVAVDGFSLNGYGSWRQRWEKDRGGTLGMW